MSEMKKRKSNIKNSNPSITLDERKKKLAKLRALEEKLRELEDVESLEKIIANSPTNVVESQSAHLNNDFESNRINELTNLVETYHKEEKIIAALINTRKILEIAQEINDPTLIKKYNLLSDKLKKRLRKENEAKAEEQRKIQTQIENLSKIINIETDVLPEIEDVPIKNAFVDAQARVESILNHANYVLNAKRVQIKNDIESDSLFTHHSGKATQKTQNFPVKLILPEKDIQNSAVPIDYIVENHFSNTPDDPIDTAIINDIIPYNYKVTQVELDGKQIEKKALEKLTPQGMQFTWHLDNLHNKEEVRMKYHLRPRISRTIVVPFQSTVKVIRTHSSLHGTQLEEEGVYNTYLSFENKFETKLNVLMEDIIPLFYMYEVEELKSLPFNSLKETTQSFVKWKLFDVPKNESSTQEYKLIELHKVEDMKINAKKILNTDLSTISPQHLSETLEKMSKAKKFLKNFHLD